MGIKLDIANAKFEVDALQDQLIKKYLAVDKAFLRAFYSDFTNLFFQFILDKVRLNEPISLSTMGWVRCFYYKETIMMADGNLKQVRDIRVGDRVISPQEDGTVQFARVTNVYNGEEICYDVVYKHGNKIKKLYSCSENHKIPFHYVNLHYRPKLPNGKYVTPLREWTIKHLTPIEFLRMAEGTRKQHSIQIIRSPLIPSFEGRENSSIDAYALGIFIGNGCVDKRNRLTITNLDREPIDAISKIYPLMSIGDRKGTECKSYRWSASSKFLSELERVGFARIKSSKKFIPKECLYSDSEYRKRLLAGLIDSDGTYDEEGNHYDYCTKSKRLAHDIRFLVFSLGGTATVRKSIHPIRYKGDPLGTYYRMYIVFRDELPNLVKRKRRKNFSFQKKFSNSTMIQMQKGGRQKVIGITIDSPSQWCITSNFCTSHNSGKSSSMITIAGLIKQARGELLEVRNICANEFEFIETLQSVGKNDVFVIDEKKLAVFGVGSVAKKLKVKDVQNIIAVNNISTLWITPTNWSYGDANYGLRAFGRASNVFPRLNRFMLYNLMAKGGESELPMGMVYIPHAEDVLRNGKELWKQYSAKKQQWVDEEQTGKGDALGEVKKQYAKKFVDDRNYQSLSKKSEKLAYISAKLGSEWTRTECNEIFYLSQLVENGMIEVKEGGLLSKYIKPEEAYDTSGSSDSLPVEEKTIESQPVDEEEQGILKKNKNQKSGKKKRR